MCILFKSKQITTQNWWMDASTIGEAHQQCCQKLKSPKAEKMLIDGATENNKGYD